ncbi:MAG: recombinase family protein [Treponema sp.]|nr:recombinase family protein [Treponema sp.]
MNHTMNKPIVTVVPAYIQRGGERHADATFKKRVAAYARVSTDSEEQLESYKAQVEHYTGHIRSNPDWDFVDVYTDEAISATNTKNREGFNTMVADALAGKIDLILTKSVSRFARNTVDSLTTVRKLKEKGVEVYFEKENIYTLDSKGELLITIMSSLAQEESRSISENVTWGQRKRMADGKVSLPYKHFLGYEKGENNLPKIVEAEAVIVRRIYADFLDGATYRGIAEYLTKQGVPTPTGRSVWSASTVRSILGNEKYAGNAVLQKKFTVDFLTKKQKVNEGEVPQYYVENSHPAVVSPETFESVRAEIRRRRTFGKKLSGSGLFFGKIVCGECGNFYGSKVWHSTDKYRRVIWQCNSKYREKTHCKTPHLTETAVKTAFVNAFNHLVREKERCVNRYFAEAEALEDTVAFDERTARLRTECAEAAALTEDCIAANARTPQAQEDYRRRYDALAERYDSAKSKLDALELEKQERAARKEKLRRFADTLKAVPSLLTEFNERLFKETVESVIVHSTEDVRFVFRSGTEIGVGIKDGN